VQRVAVREGGRDGRGGVLIDCHCGHEVVLSTRHPASWLQYHAAGNATYPEHFDSRGSRTAHHQHHLQHSLHRSCLLTELLTLYTACTGPGVQWTNNGLDRLMNFYFDVLEQLINGWVGGWSLSSSTPMLSHPALEYRAIPCTSLSHTIMVHDPWRCRMEMHYMCLILYPHVPCAAPAATALTRTPPTTAGSSSSCGRHEVTCRCAWLKS
jgi:hypothetical protein